MTLAQLFQRIALIACAAILAACASSTQIEVETTQNFPSPLVVKTDVHMGIYIPAEFESYVYEDYEKVAKKKKKKNSKKNKRGKPGGEDAGKKGESEEKNTAQEESDSKEKVEGAGTTSAVGSSDDRGEQSAEAPSSETSAAERDADESANAESSGNDEGREVSEGERGDGNSEGAGEETTEERDEEKEEEKEAEELRLKFRISLGEAQARMVRSVFPGVFEKSTMLESMNLEDMPDDIDLFMVPSITKVQYTTPKTTRMNVYEIWLQYVFSIYDRNGDVVTRWRVPSYGKTPTAMMKSKESALQTATQMALRDCGAAFSTGFRQQPAIARWLQGREIREQRTLNRISEVGQEQNETEAIQELGSDEEQAP